MHLKRGKFLLFFFILFPIYGAQTAAAQNRYSGWVTAGRSLPASPELEKIAAASPSFSSRTGADKPVDPSPREARIDFSEPRFAPESAGVGDDFRIPETRRPNFERRDISGEFSYRTKSAPAAAVPDAPDTIRADGFNWRGAVGQSLMFLGVQHGYAILGQAKTRRALKGKFWNDYVDSVKSLRGWDDGGRFFTNYIAHPLQGSFNGFIYVQNSPQARREQFSMKSIYWQTRLKAMLWTTAWSTQFEIGPISQASIGNVGEKNKQTWEDIVVTPTLGTAMLVTEDALDQYLIKAIERRTDNFYIKIFSRMLLNPTRNFSNLLRFKAPWYRDRPPAY